MFRLLARLIRDPFLNNPGTLPDADTVFATHPIQLSRWIEEIWAGGGLAVWPVFPGNQQPVPLGDNTTVLRLQLPDGLRDQTLRSGVHPVPRPLPPPLPPPLTPPIFEPPPALGVNLGPLPWDHLIYAYLVESTGVVEILGEVARRYVMGETLSTPDIDTLVWVRMTEELFFRDPPLFHIGGLVSQLRPDAQINRRNAYWRMFGCDLPHPARGAIEGQPWKRDTGSAANVRFLELWNELLRQVWLGIENDRNSAGANPTDANYIGYLCQTLGELLRLRRRGGMLAREEFAYVTLLSWFHLTVEFDTAVVKTLRAGGDTVGGNPADRLTAIGAHVGITPPRQARELFELADLLSPLLWLIELDQFSSPQTAELLYSSFGGANRVVQDTMLRIIDLWQSATGARVKDLAVTVRRTPSATTQAVQPTRLPAGATAAALSPNGSIAVPRG
jgi:hypothetical protein